MGGGAGAAQVASTAALVGFRQELYGCLVGWSDALFELCDAILHAPAPVGSVPSLSLEPVFRRSHGSLYKALAEGRIDTEALRRVLVRHRPADWPMVFAVDASTWDRCDAECSPGRGFSYSASRHSAGQPIVAGWCCQWVAQLGWARDSWTAPIDVLRIPPGEDTTSATIGQLRRLVGLLPDDQAPPLFVFDAGYDPIALSAGLGGDRASVLVRIRSDRVFYADPAPYLPAPSGGPGGTGSASPCRLPLLRSSPTPASPRAMPATARCGWRPGAACIPSCQGADDGRGPAARRSWRAR